MEAAINTIALATMAGMILGLLLLAARLGLFLVIGSIRLLWLLYLRKRPVIAHPFSSPGRRPGSLAAQRAIGASMLERASTLDLMGRDTSANRREK